MKAADVLQLADSRGLNAKGLEALLGGAAATLAAESAAARQALPHATPAPLCSPLLQFQPSRDRIPTELRRGR